MQKKLENGRRKMMRETSKKDENTLVVNASFGTEGTFKVLVKVMKPIP